MAVLALSAWAALAPPAAAAQGAATCAAIEDATERLACYDRAVRTVAPTPAPQTSPAAPPAGEAARDTAAAAPQTSPATPPAGEAARDTAAAAPQTSPAAPAAGEAARDTAAAAPPPADRTQTAEVTRLVISAVRVLPGRATTFTAADGATWVQTDSQQIVGLPEPPFDAEIRPGAMGSYFLHVEQRARPIRVRSGNR